MLQLTFVMLLVLLVLMPGVLFAVGLGLVLFIPAYLTVSSVFTLLVAPQQILAIASDKRTRRNHACEHATVNVLEESLGPLPFVGGLATPEGFYLFGADTAAPQTLVQAAQHGLSRLKNGEPHLALHPRCGTSLMMARFIFAAVFLGGLFALGYFSLAGIVLAIVCALLFGRPLGLFMQRWFTTSPRVEDIEIENIEWTQHPNIGALGWLGQSRGAWLIRTIPFEPNTVRRIE